MAEPSRAAIPVAMPPAVEATAPAVRTSWRWRHWLLPCVFAIFVAIGLCGGLLAPSDPADIDLGSRYVAPLTTIEHPLGTDQLGRDIFSRTLVGAQLSLTLAATVLGIAAGFGIAVGMIAGFSGSAVDTAIMRFADAMLAIPAIMLALLLIAVIEPGFWSVAVALILVTWARYARFVRGEVLALRSREFVEAAVLSGTSFAGILYRHFLPNVLNSVVVVLTLDIGRIILLESSLAFLGLGLPPDSGAWGSTIAEGKAYLQVDPWIALIPAIAMMLTIILANAFGNWLSDHLDPRLRATTT